MVKYRRKFGGKIYSGDTSWKLKTKAKARAKRLRKRGFKARVVYSAGVWRIYKKK